MLRRFVENEFIYSFYYCTNGKYAILLFYYRISDCYYFIETRVLIPQSENDAFIDLSERCIAQMSFLHKVSL